LAMASRGMNTIVCADLKFAAACSTARECLERKATQTTEFKIRVLQFDVTDEASVQHMVDETKRLFGRIDHFVNTAGVSQEVQFLCLHGLHCGENLWAIDPHRLTTHIWS